MRGIIQTTKHPNQRRRYGNPFQGDTGTLFQAQPSNAMMVTGTPPFMALEILLKRPVAHTWRHDLESFLFVLIWMCTETPYESLSDWRDGLTSPAAARSKRDAVLTDSRTRCWLIFGSGKQNLLRQGSGIFCFMRRRLIGRKFTSIRHPAKKQETKCMTRYFRRLMTKFGD